MVRRTSSGGSLDSVLEAPSLHTPSPTDRTPLRYSDFVAMRESFAEIARTTSTMSENAVFVAEQVYTRKLEDGRTEDAYDRMAAVAIDVASAEMKYLPEDMPYEKKLAVVKKVAKENLGLYTSNKFRANTPTNINMGRQKPVYDDDGNRIRYEVGSQMGSACFVVPIEDTFGSSVEELDGGLLEAIVTQQQLHKHGGGTGFSTARLRPAGSIIGYDPVVDGMKSIDWSSNRGVSSGPKSFLVHYLNDPTEAVKQGNSRRGANMGIQRIDHMDFLDHMYAKVGTGLQNEFKVKNFNMSMGISDEFMEAAIHGHTYTLYNPHRSQPKIKRILEKVHGVKNPEVVRRADLATRDQFVEIMLKNAANPFNPVTTPSLYIDSDGKTVVNAYTGRDIGVVVDDEVRIDARKVLDELGKLAHSNGEPGIVFLDRMNQYNAVLFDEEIEATNPCGEQPLRPNEACNLGSINAGEFIRYGRFDNRARMEMELEQEILADPNTHVVSREDGTIEVMYLDKKGLVKTIHQATRFLDNVIDRSEFPAQKVTKAVEDTRKIGLGYMGIADAMILMKRRYGSEESLQLADTFARILYEESFKASKKLAKERGVFPLWDISFYNPESEHSKWRKSGSKDLPDRHRGTRRLSEMVEEYPMRLQGKVRNACRVTQAPTGTIRRTVGQKHEVFKNLAISSGVESPYTLVEVSNILNTQLTDYSLAAVRLFEREGLDAKILMEAIGKNRGSAHIYSYTTPEVAAILETIPEDVREVLVTAAGGEGESNEVPKEAHANTLTTFQRWNDSAISKTMNLPPGSSLEDMTDFWIGLWKKGAKGATVYVKDSRDFQILNTVEGKTRAIEGADEEFRRALVQKSFTIELPYINSVMASNGKGGDTIEQEPESVFTTVTYDERARITGVFQNTSEVDAERLSTVGSRNIELSRALKRGRKLASAIADLEKQKVVGARRGVLNDEGITQLIGRDRRDLRHRVIGGTSNEALLHSLYMMSYLTSGGEKFEGEEVDARWAAYRRGAVTLRSIINTKGNLELKEDKSARPSILGAERIVQVGEGMPKSLCPECDI